MTAYNFSNSTFQGGYSCALCGMWVVLGNWHTCYPSITYPTNTWASTYSQPIDVDALAKQVAEKVTAQVVAEIQRSWRRAIDAVAPEPTSHDVGAE